MPRPVKLDNLRLLVVDDEEDARLLLREIFASSGATVMCAADATEGLAKVRTGRPDVLISDIGMPGVDGYSLIQQIRMLKDDEGGQTPAIALSAYSRAEDVERALALGYQLHACKPLDPAALISSVAKLAGRRPSP